MKNDPYGMKGVRPKIPPVTAIILRKFLRSLDGGASIISSVFSSVFSMTGVDSILVTAGDFSALLSGELFEISELLRFGN